MDRQKDLLKLCKPFFIKLTRVSYSDYNKWKQVTNHIERPNYRRRVHAWRRGDCRSAQSLKTRKVKKRTAKCALSDSDNELSESRPFNNKDNNTTLNKCEKINESETIVHNTQIQVVNSSIVLPKNNMPITDKVAWKYKRKRQRTSDSTSNKIVQEDENIEASNTVQPNNLKNESGDHEAIQVNLSKEIKIVSSRLEDSHDPQVEKWRSKKKPFSLPKSKPRLTPKTNTLNCTVCSLTFESKEQLSNHIFKHTERELQDAYKAAKTKLRNKESNVEVEIISDEFVNCNESTSKLNQFAIASLHVHNDTSEITLPIHKSINTFSEVSDTVPMVICSCHTERHPQNDASVQIEMVLYCETCHVLFRRSECFETHYRFSAKCNANRSKGRIPKLFCSTCRVLLNTLSNMRRHLQEHASINFHGTVTFVCNICRVIFFGVGTVFCTHWFNHEKDPTFVASRYSFPKLCVSTQGTKPAGSGPDEQYVFVAEYVCRICKLQFSSESELTDHTEKDCNSESSRVQLQNKLLSDLKSTLINTKLLKLKSPTNRSKKDSLSSNILNMVNNWICEFCNGSYSSRSAFEEHSIKHLQEDGYPGYSCVFQLNASTAFICNICRGIYDNLQDLMRHWVTHEVIKFICTVCNEKCSSYTSFEAHISLGCWKSKPDCRVWFNRQQHVCKICKSMFKTSEELTNHYAFDHGAETETNNTRDSPSESLPPMETLPVSKTSTSPRSKNKISSKIANAESPPHPESLSASVNSSVSSYPQNSTVTVNTQAIHLDIENAVSKEPPLQELSTIKITIPNYVDSCDNHDNNDQITFNDNSQIEISSENYQLTGATTSADLLNEQFTNISDSPLIEKSVDSQSLNLDESPSRITINDTCLHDSNLNITDTSNLDKDINHISKSIHINVGNSEILKSITSTSANCSPQATKKVLNDISMGASASESSSGSDAVEIIENSEICLNVDKIPDKVVEMNVNDEPDIIEIPNNSSGLTSNTFVQNQTINKPELMSLENCELYSPDGINSPSNVQPIYQPTTSDSENVRPIISEAINNNNQISNNIDATMQRGFLRVKKFAELQALRNYICNQCAAAFDNVKSLEEHTVAHTRRLTGNEKNPTMMAALILPPAGPDQITKNNNASTALSTVSHIAGKRTLPHIPLRVTNADARKASPLVHGQATNKIHNSQTITSTQNVPNLVIIPHIDQQVNQSYYTCPLCLVFRCESAEAFKNHLTTNHYNNILSNINTNFNNSNIPEAVLNETSKEKQKVYTCKVCKYSTTHREMVIEHIRFFHLGEINQSPHIVPRSSGAVQQVNHTIPTNNIINTNSVLPYKCSLCTNYQYNSLDELSRHFQTVHQFPQKDIYHPFICNICYHLFKTYSELIIHLNEHQNNGWT